MNKLSVAIFLALGGSLLSACDQQSSQQTSTVEESALPTSAATESYASQADGTAAATAAAMPEAAASPFATNYENQLLSNTRQLVTEGARSGEGYFSADGSEFIYQAEVAGNPFYQIFLMDLETETAHRVSTGIGLTTCSWIHPTADLVMFSSTHDDPDALQKQADEIAFRASGQERAYG